MSWTDEAAAAIGMATLGRRRAASRPLAVRAAGLAWLPIVGAALGVLAALAGGGAAAVTSPLVAAAMAVGVLEVLAGRPVTAGGAMAALCKVAALGMLPTAGWTSALVLAPALGRWAVVVQCYGGRATAGDGAPLAGRARFREFGTASVSAIGGALVALDAIGLAAVLASALTTVGLRTFAYRRGRGLDQRWLDRTETAIEAVVLAVVAAVVTVAAPRAA